MPDLPIISIVIPSYKSENTITACLDAIFSQKTSFVYEVILVDSSPGSEISRVAQLYPRLKLIKLAKKTFPGTARNAGAREAKGELILFIDSDVIISDNVLGKSFQYYRQRHDVFSGSIGISLLNGYNLAGRLLWFFETSEFKPLMPKAERPYLSVAFLAVKRELLKEEVFKDIGGGEDIEITSRLRKKGTTLYFNPEIKIYHVFCDKFSSAVKRTYTLGYFDMLLRKSRCGLAGEGIICAMGVTSVLLVPLFALKKLSNITFRNLLYNTFMDKFLYILLSPLMIILLISWSLGFCGAILERS